MEDLIKQFNTQPKCMATVDTNGIPNICLTFAARMVDLETIVLAGGFIEKSLENIKANRKATFMPWNPTILQNEYWKHYDVTGEKLCSAGYRLYCTLQDGFPNDYFLKEIQEQFRKAGSNRIPDGLKESYTVA